jgi:hypothetical protein
MFLPEKERKTVFCQKAEEILLCRKPFCPELLWFLIKRFLPGTGLTENIAYNQKSPFLQDPRKFMESRYPVCENGKDTLTKEGIKGIFFEWEYFRLASDKPPRPKPVESFPKKHLRTVESHRAEDTGLFQVHKCSPNATADIGKAGTRDKIADFEGSLSKDISSRFYAGPSNTTDLLPVERTINRHAIASPGRLLVFKGLLRLSHLSCRQLFRDQDHAALGASRKIKGKNNPQILKPDLLYYQGYLAPVADPSIFAA